MLLAILSHARVLPVVCCLGMSILVGCSRQANPVRDYAAEIPEDQPPTPMLPPASLLQFERSDSEVLSAVQFECGKEAGLFAILEIMGGGVACFDYDCDGNCDLFFAGGGSFDVESTSVVGNRSTLVRNEGHEQWSDMTTFAGVGASDLYSLGAAVIDHNHDGFPDLLVYGYQGVRLFLNQGDGTFEDVSEATGIPELPWTTAIAAFDVNGDGIQDLFGTTYVDWSMRNNPQCTGWGRKPDVCPPNRFAGTPDWCLLGTGDGRFESAAIFEPEAPGTGLGCVAFRPHPDDPAFSLYVTNDMMPNEFYCQQPDRTYEEVAFAAGVAVDEKGAPNASMGVSIMDANHDGAFDIFVTNFSHELMGLYLNQDDDRYRHSSVRYGLSRDLPGVVAFGVVTNDFDCDGDEDIFAIGGAVEYRPEVGDMEQSMVLLENFQGERFFQVVPNQDFEKFYVGRGLATVDCNNDGFLDLVSSNLLRPPNLYLNRSEKIHHWLRLRLIGTRSARIPVGTVVDVSYRNEVADGEGTSGKQVHRKQLVAAGSYLSQNQQELWFGVGDADTVDIAISWPDTQRTHLKNVAVNQAFTIVEPMQP